MPSVAIDAVESGRQETLRDTLYRWRHLFAGKHCLDFGASYGLSMQVLSDFGAAVVVGVEPDEKRVMRGRAAGWDIRHVPDTRCLPFAGQAFDFILCNAVLEHIPQPRTAYIREMWRVLARGGHLLVNETPNKYLPFDLHTTGLWFIPWLPCSVAERYARWRGWHRRTPWPYSGWRGLGHWELTSNCPGNRVMQPITNRRHRLLHALGLPAQLLDPYPEWVLARVHGY